MHKIKLWSMFKGILKYYFFCILFVSSLFIITTSAGVSSHQLDAANNIDSNITSSNEQTGITYFDLDYHNLVFNFPDEKVSLIKNKLVSQRPPHHSKLKITGRVNAKLLEANFSNSHNKELNHSKLTDKSNHCVFLI